MRVVALHRVQSRWSHVLMAGGATSNDIQEAIDGANSSPSSRCRHRRHRGPCVLLNAVLLHRTQGTTVLIPATHHIEFIVQTSHASLCSLGGKAGQGQPLTCHWVEALHSAHFCAHVTSPAHQVDEPCKDNSLAEISHLKSDHSHQPSCSRTFIP